MGMTGSPGCGPVGCFVCFPARAMSRPGDDQVVDYPSTRTLLGKLGGREKNDIRETFDRHLGDTSVTKTS